MKSQKSGNKKSGSKWWRRLIIALLTILLAPTILFSLGWFSRDLVIEGLQEWYRRNNNGNLEIGEVNATFLKGFPNVGFIIKDIHQTDFDTILDKRSSIFVKEARVNVRAKDILSGNLEFKDIRIYQAKIYSEVVSNKSIRDYIKLKKQKQNSFNSGIQLPGWLAAQKTNFSLRDVSFISKDSMLNKYFDLEIKQLKGEFSRNSEIITGNLNFEIRINDLGFNTKKGSYINGALVRGSPGFVLNQNDNQLEVPEFALKIGSQTFQTKADFDFTKITSYRFSLRNSETDFHELRSFLPDSISAKISSFELLQPIDTKLSLEGEFKYGNIPLIDGGFSTRNNQVKFADSAQLSKVNFDGYITNILAEQDSLKKPEPSRKDIKVYVEDLSAEMEDIKISAVDSYFQSSEEALNFIEANLEIAGSNKSLARLIQVSNFDFKGGNFALDTHIEGNISNPKNVLDYTTGSFFLKNTRIVLQKNKLQLPVELINLELNNKNWKLRNLNINLPNGDHLEFKGNIRNPSSLLSNDPESPAYADVSLESKRLNLNELIATAMEFTPPSEEIKENLKTLHESFETFYKKFQPHIKLAIDLVEYDNYQFNDLLADVELINAETTQVNTLSFRYDNAITEVQGTLKVPEPDHASLEPIFLNIKTNSSGPLEVFQDLFNIKLLDIEGGEFNFLGNVKGDIQEFQQLLNNVKGDLNLKNAKLYYPKAKMDIHLDSMNVEIDDSNITLRKFRVEVDGHQAFTLESTIKEFPGFLRDAVESSGNIYIKLDAEHIDVNKWMQKFQATDSDNLQKKLNNRDLTAIFADIYKFDPEFEFVIDSLAYKNLLSEDLLANVYFENDSILKLEELSIRFKNSKAKIKGQLEARELVTLRADESPFRFSLSAEASGNSHDLNDLLQTVNFNLRSGDFKFNGSYKGEAKDLKILNSSVRGDLRLATTLIDVKGTDIQIPVDSLHLEIKNNLAHLERLDVDLPGKSTIDITGEIDNFTNFINNEQTMNSHRSSFSIRSPYLDSRDIKRFLGNTARVKDTLKNEGFSMKKLKDILSNIYSSYYPSANIQIDSLIYKNLAVSDFISKIGFDDKGAINIADTKLQYSGGSILLDLEAGVQNPTELPGKINLNIENIDLGKLVKDLDYFNSEDLRQAKKISGGLDLRIDLEGKFNSQDSLDMNSLNGTIELDLNNLALYDFKPITDNVVLLNEERFEQLQFRPISQTFEVQDGNILIPRTQIQSSALQLFVEGETKIGEYYNIWISIPWNNILKSRDGNELPEKLSFEKSGAKFYLQIIQDKESEDPGKHTLKKKFRLGNRKLEESMKN